MEPRAKSLTWLVLFLSSCKIMDINICIYYVFFSLKYKGLLNMFYMVFYQSSPFLKMFVLLCKNNKKNCYDLNNCLLLKSHSLSLSFSSMTNDLIMANERWRSIFWEAGSSGRTYHCDQDMSRQPRLSPLFLWWTPLYDTQFMELYSRAVLWHAVASWSMKC